MFRFETTIARVSRAVAEIVNKEAGHNGHKNRVHDLGRGSLNNQHSAMPTDQHGPEILYEDSGWHNLFIDFSIFLL